MNRSYVTEVAAGGKTAAVLNNYERGQAGSYAAIVRDGGYPAADGMCSHYGCQCECRIPGANVSHVAPCCDGTGRPLPTAPHIATSSNAAIGVMPAEALVAELRSRGWTARADTWTAGPWGEYPMCVIETTDRGARVEMGVYFDRFEEATWFDYSERTHRVPVRIPAAALADLVIDSVGDALVHGPE